MPEEKPFRHRLRAGERVLKVVAHGAEHRLMGGVNMLLEVAPVAGALRRNTRERDGHA